MARVGFIFPSDILSTQHISVPGKKQAQSILPPKKKVACEHSRNSIDFFQSEKSGRFEEVL